MASNVSNETNVLEYRLRSLDNFIANQKHTKEKKTEIQNDEACIIKFVGNAHKIINDYSIKNSYRLEIAHHKLPKEVVIVEIIDNKYFVANDLKVYLTTFYREYGSLGIAPYYHHYQSPYLREDERMHCADTVIYCEGCGKIIEHSQNSQ